MECVPGTRTREFPFRQKSAGSARWSRIYTRCPCLTQESWGMRTRLFLIAICLLLMSAATACAGAAGEDRNGGRRGPPPEALIACETLSQGTSCSFAGHQGEQVSGNCQVGRDEQVARPPASRAQTRAPTPDHIFTVSRQPTTAVHASAHKVSIASARKRSSLAIRWVRIAVLANCSSCTDIASTIALCSLCSCSIRSSLRA